MAFEILGPIRHIYFALHHNTDSALTKSSLSTGDMDDFLREPSSYPGCNVAGHIHDDPTSTTSVHNVLHDIAVLALDPVTAHVIQDGIDTSRTVPFPTPEPSVSTSPLISIASTSSPPPGAVAIQRITDRRTSLDIQGIPSPPSPAPVLANMPPTESHLSLPAPAAPGLSHPQLPSPPDPYAATEGEGCSKVVLHKRNAPDPPSTIRETIMAAPNLPPQSPSPSSVTNVTSAGPIRRSLGAEHTGNQPLHPSHGRYDIV